MADYNVIQMKNKAGIALFPKTKINLVEGAEEFVNGLIANQIHMNVEVVNALPAEGVANKIYLVAKEGVEGNVHNEYLWVNGKFELIGDTAVSLAGYATEDFVNTAISDKVTELNLAQYAKAADLDALAGRVTTVEGKVTTLEGEMDDVQEFVAGADAAFAGKAYETTIDNHIADAVAHVTADERAAWNAKQAALTEGQLAAVNSGIDATKVAAIAQNTADIALKANAADVYTKAEAETMAEGKASAAIEALDLANTYAAKSLETTVSTLADNVIYFDVVETVTE